MAEFRTPTHQDVRKKGSKILKQPPFHNCFTLSITNKLVVIINSLKYQKLRKFYYMKRNFLYQITAASRTPDQGAAAPRSLFSLSSTEFVWIQVFWVISVQFNIRNTLPKFGPFLLTPVYTVLQCLCDTNGWLSIKTHIACRQFYHSWLLHIGRCMEIFFSLLFSSRLTGGNVKMRNKFYFDICEML